MPLGYIDECFEQSSLFILFLFSCCLLNYSDIKQGIKPPTTPNIIQ